MKVAIIGAGLAGLSCAVELEKHGISPVIYEKNGYIGEQHPHVGAVLQIAHRPIKDCIKYLAQELGLDIKPLNTVDRVIHYSPNKETIIKGNMGYFFERDTEPGDIKKQIHSKLRSTRILFNENKEYNTLSKENDYVIIANGSNNFTEELGCWKEWLNTYVKGAIVSGDFDPNTLIIWLNKDYCKNGYAYLSPFDRKRASIVLVVTEVSELEVDSYWELFLNTEKIKYTVMEEFKLNHKSGYVYPHKVGNILLTGIAGGMLDPFLGFGVVASITSGIMAARAIAEGKDYQRLIEILDKRNLQLYEFRKALNMVNNTVYDLMISSIGLPGLKHIMYDTPLNVVKLGAGLMKLIPHKR